MTSSIAPRSFVRIAVLTFALLTLGGGALASISPAEAAEKECSTSGGVTVCTGPVVIIDRVP